MYEDENVRYEFRIVHIVHSDGFLGYNMRCNGSSCPNKTNASSTRAVTRTDNLRGVLPLIVAFSKLQEKETAPQTRAHHPWIRGRKRSRYVMKINATKMIRASSVAKIERIFRSSLSTRYL